MIEMTYKDDYGVERHQQFDDPNDFIRTLSGCSTLPEHLPITSVTYNGKDVGYKGTYSGLFNTFLHFDWSAFD